VVTSRTWTVSPVILEPQARKFMPVSTKEERVGGLSESPRGMPAAGARSNPVGSGVAPDPWRRVLTTLTWEYSGTTTCISR